MRTLPPAAGPGPTCERPVGLSARDLPADVVVGAHSHEWGQLTYAADGMLRVSADGGSWIVPPQRAIWIAPHVEHEVTLLEAARLTPLRVHATRAPFPGENCRVVEVGALLRELIAALVTGGDGLPERRAALLGELILDELAQAPTRPIRVPLPRDKRLLHLCRALMEAPGDSRTLGEWARAAGASERTLARLFETELGMSFGQWRRQVRLAHGASLIARGMPLWQVAEQLGYASQSAFTAMFRKTFGAPPSAYFAAGLT
ncbi:helix-turn-helix transcriptional regulator [Massilia sp. G4R7]|uniref:Helix-turn-helix transcriptional regulator n=1 Tax=Massilia phyllostachyos TaxID=2898585 RepID=A0ABS8QA32_9BURK|nr:helix-turn-helix transcriptional regulator [Massilia phyllostachyos]MCD2518469.1 helix-turn-helix transcriptional regulator [Massilia phyllostachyos]